MKFDLLIVYFFLWLLFISCGETNIVKYFLFLFSQVLTWKDPNYWVHASFLSTIFIEAVYNILLSACWSY